MSYGEEDLWQEIAKAVRQDRQIAAGGANPSRADWGWRRGSQVLGARLDLAASFRRSPHLATGDGWVLFVGGVSISR